MKRSLFCRHLTSEDQDVLIARYGSGCYYCGTKLISNAEFWVLKPNSDGSIGVPCGFSAPNFDHQIPKSRGGSHKKDNLVPCCPRCNSSKGALTPAEFKRRLVSSGQMSMDQLFPGEVVDLRLANGPSDANFAGGAA